MTTANIELKVVSNFAWQHMKAATTFRDRLKDLELGNVCQAFGEFFIDIRSYAAASIMMTVASVEALINELMVAPGALGDLVTPKELWGSNGKGGILRRPVIDRYKVALKKLACSPIDGSAEAGEMQLVVDLRNALTHFEPTWNTTQT